MKFDLYTDPGHGWARIPKDLIVKLEIQENISTHSYVRGDNVYLEEDQDLGIFISAMMKIGKPVTFRQHHTNRTSRIRNYKFYEVPDAVQ